MGAGRRPQAIADSALDALQAPRDAGSFMGGLESPGAQVVEKSSLMISPPSTHVKHYDGQTEQKLETKPKLMPVRSVKGRIYRWLADTGASVDAIDILMLSKAGRRNVRKLLSNRTFETAAGDVLPVSCIQIKLVLLTLFCLNVHHLLFQ